MRCGEAKTAEEGAGERPPASQLGVLGGLAPGLGHRVPLLVDGELLLRRPEQVYPQAVAETNEKEQDVRRLQLHLRELLLRELVALLRGEPQEMLQQLPGLRGQGHSDILGSVELLPVALGDELVEA